MANKALLVCAAHFLAVALLLKFLDLVLPYSLTAYWRGAADLLLCLLVARVCLRFSKQYFLDERIQPENRAVFITGCDSGFGHHLARHLDAKGFHVFAGCLDPLGPGAQRLLRSCPGRLQVLGIDVTREDSVAEAARSVRESLGTSELWAIVNNAGIMKGYHAELSPMSDFKDCMEVNALGPVRVTKAFLPLLRQSRGRVVNVASMAGRVPHAYITPYTMSKWAAVGFTGCLRQEMSVWGIKVISIEPEGFKTDLTDPEVILQKAKIMTEGVEASIREDYGEKFMRSLPTSIQALCSLTHWDLGPVLDAIEDAVSLEYPDSVYKPSRNLGANAIMHLVGCLPDDAVDLVTKVHCAYIGIPTPKEAENYL